MINYLAYDLKYKSSSIEKVRSSLRFILGLVPDDLPFNTNIGVEIPSSILVDDFCSDYKKNLELSIKNLSIPVTVDSVTISGSRLKVVIKYSNDTVETWSLSV